jgi:AcrR family transcriptional regulator
MSQQAVGRGRPRSEASRDAILRTFLEHVGQMGYPSVTIDGVAKAAQVGRMTIYRWYPSKAALALDAALYIAKSAPLPDTGNLTSDLLQVLTPTIKALNTTGPLFAGLMAEAQTDPIVGPQFVQSFVASRRALLKSVFRHAQKRGEMHRSADLDLLVDFVYGPLWYRLLSKHAPLDEAFIRSLTKTVVHAVKP